jgi:hypothetical protein
MAKVLNKRHPGVDAQLREGTAVYVGRPTKWGNPFVIGRDGTREQVIAKYAAWVEDQAHEVRTELRGKDLVCWCAPAACHADILLEIANS